MRWWALIAPCLASASTRPPALPPYIVPFNPAIGFTTGYQSLGGIVIGGPSCAQASGGQVTCAVVGTDDSLFGIRFNPAIGFTTGYQSLGGIVIGGPSCAQASGGQVTCAVVGTDSSLFGITIRP